MQRKPYHIEILLSEISKRKLNNSRYSLRAFAGFLGLVPSSLSRILACRQELSIATTKQIIKKLKLSEDDGLMFIASIAEEKKCRALKLLFSTLISDSGESDDEFNDEYNNECDSGPLVATGEWILAQSPDLVFVADRFGRCLYVNESAARRHGLVPSQVIGKTMSDMNLPEDLIKNVSLHMKTAIDTNAVVKAESFFPHRNGNRWFEVIYSPVFRRNGQVRAIACHLRDVTDRKSVELKLKFLTQAGQLMSSSPNYEDNFKKIAALAVQDLADGFAVKFGDKVIYQLNEISGLLENSLKDLFLEFPLEKDSPYVYQVTSNTEATLLDYKIEDHLVNKILPVDGDDILSKRLNVGSFISVPMKIEEKSLGTIILIRSKAKDSFNGQDLELAMELGARSACAINYILLQRRN